MYQTVHQPNTIEKAVHLLGLVSILIDDGVMTDPYGLGHIISDLQAEVENEVSAYCSKISEDSLKSA